MLSSAFEIPCPRFVEIGRATNNTAILAKFYLDETRENLESLENHGEKRRFKIYDALSGKNRKMSLFDLERRAEKNAARSKEVSKTNDAAKRDELRKNLIESELHENADGLKRIKTILHNLIARENKNLLNNPSCQLQHLIFEIRKVLF